jgi:hypothetical protein
MLDKDAATPSAVGLYQAVPYIRFASMSGAGVFVASEVVSGKGYRSISIIQGIWAIVCHNAVANSQGT